MKRRRPDSRGSSPKKGIKQRAQQTSKSAPAKEDAVRYAVVITNVEHDPTRIHHAYLPGFCGLKSEYERASTTPATVKKAEAGETSSHLYYEVRCRGETCSAEVSLYAPANASCEEMLQQRLTAKEAKRHKRPKAITRPAAADGTKESGDIVESVNVLQSLGVVEGLALRLRGKPYFGDRIPLDVHVPGREDGDVLLNMASSLSSSAAVAGADPTSVESSVAGKVSNPSPSSDKQAAGNEILPPHGGSTELLKQLGNRQNDFVTAVAALSAKLKQKAVQERLQELPGFLSCWRIYERHFRVVFANATALFKAKQLLDQFELDDGVRVSIILSDTLAQGHTAFTAAQETENIAA